MKNYSKNQEKVVLKEKQSSSNKDTKIHEHYCFKKWYECRRGFGWGLHFNEPYV